MTTATPDKPETVPPTCHPVTLKMLEATLPTLRKINSLSPPSNPKSRDDAADELRENFPALDDLTLAAMCGYFAMSSVAFAQSSGSSEHIMTAITFAELALALAWSLGTPEAPERS